MMGAGRTLGEPGEGSALPRARKNCTNAHTNNTNTNSTKHTAIYPASGLTEGDNTPTAASMVYMI